jgi:hypothetical protein
MSAALEAFLARIYVDGEARARFLENPSAEARRAGLPADACSALAAIDRRGVQMAAATFERKRGTRVRRPPWLLPFHRLRRWLGRGWPRFAVRR